VIGEGEGYGAFLEFLDMKNVMFVEYDRQLMLIVFGFKGLEGVETTSSPTRK